MSLMAQLTSISSLSNRAPGYCRSPHCLQIQSRVRSREKHCVIPLRTDRLCKTGYDVDFLSMCKESVLFLSHLIVIVFVSPWVNSEARECQLPQVAFLSTRSKAALGQSLSLGVRSTEGPSPGLTACTLGSGCEEAPSPESAPRALSAGQGELEGPVYFPYLMKGKSSFIMWPASRIIPLKTKTQV